MNIGDKVIPLAPIVDKDGQPLNLAYYTVSAITLAESGGYRVELAESDKIDYPEELFEAIPPDFLSSYEKIIHDLHHWRSELIKFENRNDEEQIRKIYEILDFFLDKLLVQKKNDQAAIEALIQFRSEHGSAK